MDQQVAQTVEQSLRANWQTIRRTIQDRFPTVSQVDLDSAHSVNDLCARIADKTGYSERYIEAQLIDQVLRGNGRSLIGDMDLGQPGQTRPEFEQTPLNQPVHSGQTPVTQRQEAGQAFGATRA